MSVKAYQFSVERYNSWMNLYAIITGAFFIALYTIETKAESACVLTVLKYMVSILGFASTLCWLLSVRGHYEWTKSFIKILKRNENNYIQRNKCSHSYVYDGVCFEKQDKLPPYHLPGFFSTQKITIIFLKIVLCTWLWYILYISTNCFCISLAIAVGICLLIILASKFILNHLRWSCLCSTIDKVRA